MKLFIPSLLFCVGSHLVLAIEEAPALCVSSPAIPLQAGVSEVSATVDNPFQRKCTATLNFSSQNALPVTYHFDQKTCKGRQLARFLVPQGVPNGQAFVTWRCASKGVLSCSQYNISGGLGDSELETEKNGTVGCILESVQTHTTLSTLISPSTTSTVTITSLLTNTITSSVMMAPGGATRTEDVGSVQPSMTPGTGISTFNGQPSASTKSLLEQASNLISSTTDTTVTGTTKYSSSLSGQTASVSTVTLSTNQTPREPATTAASGSVTASGMEKITSWTTLTITAPCSSKMG